MINKITKKYSKKILQRSALNLKAGDSDMQYFMTKAPINNALEIGTFRGITSAFMSQYCKHLYTIDLAHGQIQKIKGTVDWADTEMRHDVWKYLGINNIDFIPVDNDVHKKEVVNNLDFDFAFIDGDHSYKGVKYDFEMVKKCGRVLFHDYDDNGKKCPVRDFIKSINYGNIETTKDYAYWTK